jgi:Carboxypeptidase regulatory-like domain
MRKWMVCAASVMLLVAGAEAVAPPPPQSVVIGRCTKVTHPGRPGARTTRTPLAGVEVAAYAGGRPVAEGVSDAQGNFRLRLPPGKYRISFVSPKGIEDQHRDISIDLRGDTRKEIVAEFHIYLK